MTAEAVAKAIIRLSHQITEQNVSISDLRLVGIRSRGVPLARRIQTAIHQHSGVVVPCQELDVSPYRDDVATVQDRPPDAQLLDIDGRVVVLVDDVLYTARTARAALDALVDSGRPAAVRLVVLVDRGHRELPIRADYVGKNIPTARDESIRVRLVETDGVDEVLIIRKGAYANS